MFGTCAGMILLARKLDNDSNVYFGALDAVVRRNAYGRQLGSFAATADSVPLLAIPPFRLRRGSTFRKVPLPSPSC